MGGHCFLPPLVCQLPKHFLIYRIILGFLAPDKVDSKFFDPKFAFKEVEVQAKTVTELVTKKKPKVCLRSVAILSDPGTLGRWSLVGPIDTPEGTAQPSLIPFLRLKAMLRATLLSIIVPQSQTSSEPPTQLTSSPKPAK